MSVGSSHDVEDMLWVDATEADEEEEEDEEVDLEGNKESTRRPGGTPQRWAVDHSTGHHRLHAARFIERALAEDFEPADALKMIQEKHTIDFGSARAGGTQARPSDNFYPSFYLDFFSVVGRPGRAISRPDGPIFDNITVSFQRWSAPYGAKHVSGVPFDMTGRTFRIAQAATREIWFIVMHPVTGEVSELPSSAADARRRREQAGERSGMPVPLACELASYITDIFQLPALLGEGVERSWRPGGRETQRISSARWMAFQEAFMAGWAAWSARCGGSESFWAKHEPAFHAYDYGANIEIEVSDELYELPRERHCSMEETDDDEDEAAGEEEEEEEEGERDDDVSRETLRLEALSVGGRPTTRARGGAARGRHADGVEDARYERILRECNGLRKLVSELETRFHLQNITAVSYALAVCINCDRPTGGDADSSETRCLYSLGRSRLF